MRPTLNVNLSFNIALLGGWACSQPSGKWKDQLRRSWPPDVARICRCSWCVLFDHVER
jgi:hypothetical protein